MESTLVSVDVSSDVPPAPYVALSPLYRFAPDGLTFAVPATVRIAAPGATSLPANASIFWSASTPTSGAYTSLPTTLTGSTATALVTHFSSGFLAFVPEDAGSDASAPGDASDARISEAGPADGGDAAAGGATVDVAPDASGPPDAAGDADGQVDAAVDGGVTSVSGVVNGLALFGNTVTISVQELSNVPDGAGGCSSQTATGEQQVTIPANALPYLYRLTFPAGLDDVCTGRSYVVQAVESTLDGGLEALGTSTCSGTSGGTVSCDVTMSAPPMDGGASSADASDGSAGDEGGDAADANVDGGDPFVDTLVFTGTITGTVPAGTSWINVQLFQENRLYALVSGSAGPVCTTPTIQCAGMAASELLLPSLPATFTLTVQPSACVAPYCGPNGEPFCGAQFSLEAFAADANGFRIPGTAIPTPVGCGGYGVSPLTAPGTCTGVTAGGPDITSDSVDCGTFVMQ